VKLKITHTTRYIYDAPVVYGLQQVRMTPVTSPHQTVLNWSLCVKGGAQELRFVDQYENRTLLIQAEEKATEIALTMTGEVETHTTDGIYGQIYGVAPLWHFLQDTARTAAGTGIIAL